MKTKKVSGAESWRTGREVAKRLKVTRQRVHQFVREGRLIAVRLWGRDLFDAEEVERFAQLKRPCGRRGRGKKRASQP
jgi:excisionase family DNA binding protein